MIKRGGGGGGYNHMRKKGGAPLNKDMINEEKINFPAVQS